MRNYIQRFFMPLALAACTAGGLNGQVSIADSAISLGYVSIAYGGFFPGNVLAERFGYLNHVGTELGYKHKSNFYVQGDGGFLFTDRVKEVGLIDALGFSYLFVDSNGEGTLDAGFIDGNGLVHGVRYTARGGTAALRVGYNFGKLMHGKRTNPNTGLFVDFGGQWLRHKIQIIVPSEEIPWNDKDFLRGYDRMTQGLGITQRVGYRFYGNKRYINFFVAAEFSQNWTRSARAINYDTNTVDDAPRLDILTGFRAGWCLPLYKVAPEKSYYY